jgi:hypothetical protein
MSASVSESNAALSSSLSSMSGAAAITSDSLNGTAVAAQYAAGALNSIPSSVGGNGGNTGGGA